MMIGNHTYRIQNNVILYNFKKKKRMINYKKQRGRYNDKKEKKLSLKKSLISEVFVPDQK